MDARRSGLKGLEALSGDMAALDRVAAEGRVLELRPDQILLNPQVRTTFQDIEELAQSIEQDGQKQACVVGPLDSVTGKYPLQIGERRVRAISMIPGRKVLVVVDANEHSPAALIRNQVIENEQRNNLLPHEVGVSIKRYREARLAEGAKLTLEDVAKEWKKSVQYINLHAQFAELPDSILGLIINNVTRDAELIFSLKQYHKVDPAACEEFIEAATTDRELMTREIARAKVRAAKGKTPPPPTPAQAPASPPVADDTGGTENHQGGGSAPEQQGAQQTNAEQGAGAAGAPQDTKPDNAPQTPPQVNTPSGGEGNKPPQQERRARNQPRTIDANRIVIAVKIALDEAAHGLLLVNKVVDGQPGKCVVEIIVGGKAMEKVVDTDSIDIISMAEIAACD